MDNSDLIPKNPENDGMETQLSKESVETVKNALVKAQEKLQDDSFSPANKAQDEPKKNSKYSENLIVRCKMEFFLTNGQTHVNEITVQASQIEQIQKNMCNSLESKEGGGIIYLQGSKTSEADFVVLPVKNILYLKFNVEEIKK
jgi:hypothetical protein